ncbi:MAG: TIGR04255 family protein [Terracidiphilus sp.]
MSNHWMSEPLPEYERPPVVETALAVEFAQLPGWNVVHFGALWERFKAEYPSFETHPYVNPFIPGEFSFDNPPLRCFFVDVEGTQVVQVRSGAFVRNWRARPQNNIYPRYATIRPSFERDFQTFGQFLQEFRFAPLEIWKCEVTYINHFVHGREWEDVLSLSRILPILSPDRMSGLLTNISHARFAVGFELPEDAGTLQVELVPLISPEGKQVMQLGLTAVGRPRGSDVSSILEWLDKGHYAVVKGFSEFTSIDSQRQYWGREWR